MPNRILKESITTSDTIDRLSAFEETMFYRLIVTADDYGRFDARPQILKARLYPLKKDVREKQIMVALRKICSVELAFLYTVDGKPFGQIESWDRHQQIRAKKSKCPAPAGDLQASDIICNQMISDDIRCTRNPIQSEYESESESDPCVCQEDMDGDKSRRGPSVFEVMAWCRSNGLKMDNPDKFVAYHEMTGWRSRGEKVDWHAAARYWCLNREKNDAPLFGDDPEIAARVAEDVRKYEALRASGG